MAYTNHTLLPEALEKWPLPLFKSVLPRHLEIIYEINWRFLDDMRLRFPFDLDKLSRLSIIDEQGEHYVRMAHLACVGSFAINGVAALHTQLLGDTVLKDIHDVWPEKFQNKTNGVTPRRFMMLSNPGLAQLITDTLGTDWTRDLTRLRDLEEHADNAEFRHRWREVKLDRKRRLAEFIGKQQGIEIDPHSLFDIQVKRIHEYKRQHLNLLHVVSLYLQLKRNPGIDMPSRTFVFGGKAAPGYQMAKLIIKLINSVADIVNRDPALDGRLKVAFVPNFSVKTAQLVYPAADLSEQISTAGKEASGTGNMKFSMNGALTIGTLDGANVEIREEVGPENFFLFGLNAKEVEQRLADGYSPQDAIYHQPELREALDLIGSGLFSHGDGQLFAPFLDSLWNHDPYLVGADFGSYAVCQEAIGRQFKDSEQWSRMSILNVARIGKFSSDRAIREYCEDIWRVRPTPVRMD
jgi:starch phosphorylase